jgi:tRNA-intron endonuclease
MAAIVKALLEGSVVRTENSDDARELFKKNLFGGLLEDGRVQLSPIEAVYLTAKKRIKVLDGKGKTITVEKLIAKTSRKDKNFWPRYSVFKDLRDRGYIVKTALKFGADFRVYERGVKPGEDHAKWIVYPASEHERMTWQEFAARNRVAHSTKKNLLVGIVDDEGDVSYWEVRWLKP